MRLIFATIVAVFLTGVWVPPAPPPPVPNEVRLSALDGPGNQLTPGATYPIAAPINWREKAGLRVDGQGAIIECNLPAPGGVCVDLTDSDDVEIRDLFIRVTGAPPSVVVLVARSKPSANSNFVRLWRVTVVGGGPQKIATMADGGTAFLVYGAEFWEMWGCGARVQGKGIAGRRVLNTDLAVTSPHGPVAEHGGLGVSQVLGYSFHCAWTVFGDVDSVCNQWGRGVVSIESRDSCSLQGGLYADVVGGSGGSTMAHRIILSGLREGNPDLARRAESAGVRIDGPVSGIDVSGLYVKGAEPPTPNPAVGFAKRVSARNPAHLAGVRE
ncbi:MAG: hypothetical protein U0990_09680 [Candidatus Nanopelagicales bacterium]|nr:hypothetical protein [Candidatus Nanopelagicales bacterium]